MESQSRDIQEYTLSSAEKQEALASQESAKDTSEVQWEDAMAVLRDAYTLAQDDAALKERLEVVLRTPLENDLMALRAPFYGVQVDAAMSIDGKQLRSSITRDQETGRVGYLVRLGILPEVQERSLQFALFDSMAKATDWDSGPGLYLKGLTTPEERLTALQTISAILYSQYDNALLKDNSILKFLKQEKNDLQKAKDGMLKYAQSDGTYADKYGVCGDISDAKALLLQELWDIPAYTTHVENPRGHVATLFHMNGEWFLSDEVRLFSSPTAQTLDVFLDHINAAGYTPLALQFVQMAGSKERALINTPFTRLLHASATGDMSQEVFRSAFSSDVQGYNETLIHEEGDFSVKMIRGNAPGSQAVQGIEGVRVEHLVQGEWLGVDIDFKTMIGNMQVQGSGDTFQRFTGAVATHLEKEFHLSADQALRIAGEISTVGVANVLNMQKGGLSWEGVQGTVEAEHVFYFRDVEGELRTYIQSGGIVVNDIKNRPTPMYGHTRIGAEYTTQVDQITFTFNPEYRNEVLNQYASVLMGAEFGNGARLEGQAGYQWGTGAEGGSFTASGFFGSIDLSLQIAKDLAMQLQAKQDPYSSGGSVSVTQTF